MASSAIYCCSDRTSRCQCTRHRCKLSHRVQFFFCYLFFTHFAELL